MKESTKKSKPHAHMHHIVIVIIVAICNVDFVSFHNVTFYINSLLSHIHVTTKELLNIT